MKTITNKLKVALVAVGFLAVGTVSAQSTSDVAKGATAIRLIDNKGTIKYLQSNNGITQIVNTTNDRTTTTWQLGGTLNTATTIGLDGNTFTIDGNTFTLLGTDEVDAATVPALDQVAATAYGADGFTILVKDETDGTVRKILASDLLQVQGIRVEHPAAADSTANLDINVTDMTATVSLFKVSVYRNGAKLRAGTDYILGAGVVTVQPQALAAPNDYNNWEIYQNDIFEIHWIK